MLFVSLFSSSQASQSIIEILRDEISAIDLRAEKTNEKIRAVDAKKSDGNKSYRQKLNYQNHSSDFHVSIKTKLNDHTFIR